VLFVVTKVWEGEPKLHCTILQPLAHPDGMRVQVILLRDTGKKPIESLCVRIKYHQSSSFDYRIESVRKPTSQNRTTEELFFELESLAPKEVVKVIFEVGASAPPIPADAIEASYKDGYLDQNRIATKRWENLE